MNKRIFVEKRRQYNQEARELEAALNREFGLGLTEVHVYVIYDLYGIDATTYEQAKTSVFSEVMIDQVYEILDLKSGHYLAYEVLPAQYDQRADAAMQAMALLNDQTRVLVRSGKLVTFDRALTEQERAQVEKFLINPIEARVKDLAVLDFQLDSEPTPLRDLGGFNQLGEGGLLALKQDLGLAMNLADLRFIQDYFRSERRDPTETELYVLDCYWSDHCRHTTFETILDRVTFRSQGFQAEMQAAYEDYLALRQELGLTKPVTLMDMASIMGKYHVRVLGDQAIEVSEEINACSFFVDIELAGEPQRWLVQFKNETHNHPSEIEPFGGASTCIGGAIRDPLSGRSYVYQAMRVSGSGNILAKRDSTLEGKLPQVNISTGTAHGNSSYGNQIGLATTFVRELYDDSYIAKHLEVGAVVGAVQEGHYQRQSLVPGDIVILIGGRTGRDGIQGASGSSLEHTSDSLETAASQVQKGNAPEERKLQRLFRQPEVTRLIKKCNDFGAGGVCVAIGELAEGIEIHLDRILTKYQGLNPTELAISESQERLAVALEPKDYETFVTACRAENIEYAHVATVTDRRRLEMFYGQDKVVDMGADFLATAGVQQHASAQLEDNEGTNPFTHRPVTKSGILQELASLNVTCQKGLAQQFDASIGNSSVLMPFAGRHQLTPVQASVQALPTLHATSDTATILTYGFIPRLSHYSPFLSAIYAVLESVAKVYAVGGSKDSLYFSFQEYFEKLNQDPRKWGKVTQALLGSLVAQRAIGRPSIGGKDSMSGTFHDLNVVETLISFACAPVKIDQVISPELKAEGNRLYHVPLVRDAKGFPDIPATMAHYEAVHDLIQAGSIVSVYVQEEGSLVASLVKMALGSGLGFDIQSDHALDFDVASLVVESQQELDFPYLGRVRAGDVYLVNEIQLTREEIYQAYTQTLNDIYPLYQNETAGSCDNLCQETEEVYRYPDYVEQVQVVIPVFPGTNCEYDSERAFLEAGASTQTVIIRNLRPGDIEASVRDFVAALQESHILFLPGGFSSGDEPDGSAKFIVNFLKHPLVTEAVHRHLAEKKLILGICNGFQALIKSGLLPYGRIQDLTPEDLTLYRNDSYRHISTTAFTRVASTRSPWTQGFEVGQRHEVAFSHGEGKLVGDQLESFKHLAAFQYCDLEGQASLNGRYNPNGSGLAIEGLVSEDGLILGKMGHSERYHEGLYKTHTIKGQQAIFANGVRYFKGGK